MFRSVTYHIFNASFDLDHLGRWRKGLQAKQIGNQLVGNQLVHKSQNVSYSVFTEVKFVAKVLFFALGSLHRRIVCANLNDN